MAYVHVFVSEGLIGFAVISTAVKISAFSLLSIRFSPFFSC